MTQANAFTSDADSAPLAFDDPDSVRVALERRVATLTDELQRRVERIEDLERQLAHHARLLGDPGAADKALQYDALMATRTMRALAKPRAVYGALLARRAR